MNTVFDIFWFCLPLIMIACSVYVFCMERQAQKRHEKRLKKDEELAKTCMACQIGIPMDCYCDQL